MVDGGPVTGRRFYRRLPFLYKSSHDLLKPVNPFGYCELHLYLCSNIVCLLGNKKEMTAQTPSPSLVSQNKDWEGFFSKPTLALLACVPLNPLNF
jgi:hypothetical protein